MHSHITHSFVLFLVKTTENKSLKAEEEVVWFYEAKKILGLESAGALLPRRRHQLHLSLAAERKPGCKTFQTFVVASSSADKTRIFPVTGEMGHA